MSKIISAKDIEKMPKLDFKFDSDTLKKYQWEIVKKQLANKEKKN